MLDGAACSVRLYVGSNLPDQPGKRISDKALRRALTDLTSTEFVGATFTQTLGLWDGEVEASYIIEIFPAEDMACDVLFQRGNRLARKLATELRQTAVMVISTDASRKDPPRFRSAPEVGGVGDAQILLSSTLLRSRSIFRALGFCHMGESMPRSMEL